MSITVDTISLRYRVTTDYDSQQTNQMRSDLKDLEKEAANTRRAVEKNSEAYKRLGDEIEAAKKRRDQLASKRSRTDEEEKELAKLIKRIGELNKRRDEARDKSAELSEAYRKQVLAIQELQAKLNKHVDTVGLANTNLAELTKRQREYNAILRNLKPNTDDFNEYAEKLREVNEQIKQTKEAITGTQESLGKFGSGGFLKNLIGAKFDFGGIKSLIAGNAITGAATFVFDTVADYAGRAFDRVKTLVTESVAAARAAEGITRAFKSLDSPGLLDNLRKATHGTVADLELMKAAVQANDFRLPLDQLGKYLEFAQLKAQQTGQSVDFLTTSIVTGLGRKSLQILDNLGLSAAEIKEEMAKTGDMATAVGNIIDRQLAEAGEHFETAAEREERATTGVTNAQLELGQQMRKTFGIGSTSFSEMQAKAETFVLKGLTKTIIFCQDLYNRLVSVRVVVETVKTAFDTVFKVCEVGFKWLIDAVKGVARTFRNLGGMMEALLSFSPERIEQAWQKMLTDMGRTAREFVDDGKDVGRRWGQNVNDSIRAVMGNAKVEGPAIVTPKGTPATPSAPGGSPAGPASSAGSTTAVAAAGPDDNYQRDLEAREQAYREYGNQLRKMLLEQLLTEKEYQQESLLEEKKFLADKIALQELYGKDSTQTQAQFLDLMIREADDKYKQEKQNLQDSLAKADTDHAAQTARLMEQRLSGELDTEKRYNELKLQADIDYQRRRLEILRAAGADTGQAEQQLLQLQLQQHRQAEQEQTQTLNDEEQKRKNIREAAQQATQQLLSSASSLFSAMQQRETAEVDAKYKRLIAAAKKQGRDTTKLEEQQEQEKAAVQKKYAERNFQIQVLQIIANTAQGITKTIAELGMPWAIPFVAMATASGAMQLAAAKAAADQAAGLYSGGYSATVSGGSPAGTVQGYTAKGNPREQAGVIPVHKNEFVANHHAVANPQVRPVLDVIDAHQRRGDIQMLNATRLLEEAYGPGRYRGGYTGGTDSVLSGSPAETTPADTLQPILERIERNTARSLTVRQLRDEIAHEEQLERNARR